MTFYNFTKALIAVFYLCLVASDGIASKVYEDCGESSRQEICIFIWDDGYRMSHRKDDEFYGYGLTRMGSRTTIYEERGPNVPAPFLAIGFGELTKYRAMWTSSDSYLYDLDSTISDVFPGLKEEYLKQSHSKRKNIQKNLKKLELYKSNIDGQWGRETFIGLISYNALFNKKIPVSSNKQANDLFDKIINHRKFSYLDGKLTLQAASSSLGSNVYKECSLIRAGILKKENDICHSGSSVIRGTSYGVDVIYSQQKNGKVSISTMQEIGISINDDGSAAYNTLRDYSDIFPSLTEAFIGISKTKRKSIQKNLKRLELYNSARDGLWGPKTFSAILAYNALFNVKIKVSSEKKSTDLLYQILNHNRFDYKNGKINSQIASSSTKCVNDPGVCSPRALCSYAVSRNGDEKKWSTHTRWLAHVAEAKKRGLNCDVQFQSASSCDNDPNICGAVELCQKASVKQNGKQTWRKSSAAAPFVKAAKSIGLTCNVLTEPLDEEVYRVATGTGFFVSENGYIVTNQHVIDGCTETRVHSRDKTLPSSLIAKDAQNDVALLQVDFSPKQFFKLSEENPSLLQEIIAAGYPFGNQISKSIKVTRGIVSATAGLGDNVSQIQIDAALQPGNSGGPIIDDGGSVVGVAVSKLDAEYTLENFGTLPENTNFGIKVSVVKSLLESNSVPFKENRNGKMQRTELGKLVTDGTVFLSCWMTTAQYEKMKTKKAMFDEIEKN